MRVGEEPMKRPALLVLLLIAFVASPALAQNRLRRNNVDVSRLKTMTWKIGDDVREALVYIPDKPEKNPPVIFAFHGHGGTSTFAARQFDFHDHWPEAICV